jgi:oligoendopeptidase F
MTLAETASIHAEGLLRDALLAREDVAPGARLQVLAGSLDHAATFVCDIHMRFLFERAFYEERGRGEVGVSRLKELMLQAQQECYGDTLDPDEQDPMFWASKLHFHIAGVSFYNFPYTFGYLFSLSLAAQARQMPAARFHERYENLLRLTGSMTAEEVARESFGLDIGEEAFWLQALDLVDEERARLEELLAAMPKD